MVEAASALSLAPVAHRIRAPLVVVRAGNDVLVPPDDANRLLDAASSPVKKLLDFPGTTHAAVERFSDAMDATLDFVVGALGARAK